MKTFEYSLESQLKKLRNTIHFNLNKMLTSQNYNVRILKEDRFFSKWTNRNFSRDILIKKIDDNLSLMNLFNSKNIVKIEKIENKIYILIYKIESIGQGVTSLYETTPKTTCVTYKFIITELN